MSIVLLITVTLALTLVYWKYQPPQTNSDNNVCNTFDKKHILQETSDGNLWDKYLSKNGFCDRETDQQSVEGNCNGNGRYDSDLCISDSPMLWNDQPCQKNYNNNMYKTFITQHIVPNNLDPNSIDAWKGYLKGKKLCDRPTQSFLESLENVKKICNGEGYQFGGDLCISGSPMLVYVLKVKTGCSAITLSKRTERVVVACDKIGNQCVPVHFEMSTNQGPPPTAKPCKP